MSFQITLTAEGSFPVHSRSISSLKFSPDGKYLASSSADCTAKVLEVGKWDTPICTFSEVHKRGISEVSWSPDSKYLATASDDSTIAVWTLPEKETATTISVTIPSRTLTGHTSFVYCVAFSPNGSILASGGYDDSLRLWDIRNGCVYKEIAAHGDPVTSVSFSTDGTTLLTSSFDGLMRLWDVDSGRCLKTIVDNNNPPVTSATFTQNSKYILATTLDNHIRLWAPLTSKCIRSFSSPGFTVQKFPCVSKIFVHQASETIVLISASEDGAIYMWNLVTSVLLGRWQVLEDKSPLLALDISPDQKYIVCSGLEPEHTNIFIFSLNISE